jgi:hypothetical protein
MFDPSPMKNALLWLWQYILLFRVNQVLRRNKIAAKTLKYLGNVTPAGGRKSGGSRPFPGVAAR